MWNGYGIIRQQDKTESVAEDFSLSSTRAGRYDHISIIVKGAELLKRKVFEHLYFIS